MAKVVLLDAGPLGYMAHGNPPPHGVACREWAVGMKRKGALILVPEVADYEVRRSLIRIHSGESIAELDHLAKVYEYLPLNTDAMRKAAELWATARITGLRSLDDDTFDGDVILAAQAFVRGLENDGADNVWIASDNLGDLQALYPKSELWEDITTDPNQQPS